MSAMSMSLISNFDAGDAVVVVVAFVVVVVVEVEGGAGAISDALRVTPPGRAPLPIYGQFRVKMR